MKTLSDKADVSFAAIRGEKKMRCYGKTAVRAILTLLCVCSVISLTLTGCRGGGAADETTADARGTEPFGGAGGDQCRYAVVRRLTGDVLCDVPPLRMLDLQTGEVSVLCPVPSCPHDRSDPGCPYADIASIPGACYGGGYTLFFALHMSDTATGLYLYDHGAESLRMLRTVDFSGSGGIFYGGGVFYFSEASQATDAKGIRLRMITALDPKTGDETVFAHVPGDERLYDVTDGYLITCVGGGQYFNRIETKAPYGKAEIPTPSGSVAHSVFDQTYMPGNVAAKFLPPASVYLYDKAEYLKLPVDCRITTVKRTGDTVMFQTVTEDPKYILKGLDENGNEASAYLFDPVVYFVKENGDYEAFELETDYSLNITMAYGHKILAVSDTRKEGDRLISDGRELVLLFDLDTGKTFEYDFGAYDKEGKFVEIPTKEFTTKINKLH